MIGNGNSSIITNMLARQSYANLEKKLSLELVFPLQYDGSMPMAGFIQHA